jgi:hypothetical protein
VLRAQFKFEKFRFYALDFNSSDYKRHAATAAAQEVQPIRPNIQVGFQMCLTEEGKVLTIAFLTGHHSL